MIQQKKWQQLQQWMEQLQLKEDDISEKFILGSGRGGQKVQKTASCVYLKHNPTGIEIKCQESRLRETNRFYARRRLCEKVEEKLLKAKSKRQQEIEKIRKQKRKRSKRAQQKILADKNHRSNLKETRTKPKLD